MDKKHIWRYYGNFIFFCAAFSLFEVLLRLSTPVNFDIIGFFFAAIFSSIIAVTFCAIMSFLRGKAHTIVSNIVLSLVAALYISQIIYYNVFGTFYNTESMFNAGQITQFWVVILGAIGNRVVFILLCCVPIALYNIFVRKIIIAAQGKSLRRLNRMDAHWFSQIRQATAGVCVGLYIMMFTAFMPFAVNPFSAYSAFFGQHEYEESIKRTGFLSTLQIDVLKLFITKDSSAALSALDELRNMESVSVNRDITEPQVIVTPEPQLREDDATTEDLLIEDGQPPEPTVYGYNIMDIDFETLIENESRANIRALHEYFSKEQPSQQNEFTGMFEGYNLIKFVAEGFSPIAVHEELTPTLYKMVHEGFHFTNFYTPSWGVSTSDGEYVACMGLFPKSGVWSFYRSRSNYLPFVMGNQLRNIGYFTVAYHNHTYSYYRRHLSHPNMGYDYFGVGNGLVLPNTLWPNSDLEMMEATVDNYINNQPFHAYYMTVSGHLQYNFGGNMMSRRNRDAVEHLPYSDSIKAYIACNLELEYALTYLMERLNEAGIAENTFIVLSTDHYPYGLDTHNTYDAINEYYGRTIDRTFELYENHLIIYAQGMEPVTVDKPSSSVDIIPTISNLMGLEFDSRLLVGRDILSNSDPLVVFMDRSFITKNGRRVRNEEFIPNPGVTVDEFYADYIRAIIDAKFSVSTSILDLDYYRIVFNSQ